MKKILLLSTLALSMAFTSCDSYLDINTSPNSPSEGDVTASMLMPSAEMNITSAYGDVLRISGGYLSQYYAQEFGTSNFLDYSKFQMSPTNSNGAYTNIMEYALKNIETIRSKSSAGEDWGTYLAATTLKAFSLQALVDCYGSIPYSEAWDITNVAPKYDEGDVVYAGLISDIDYALSKVKSTDQVCTNFLFPKASADEWIKFANAVELRLLSRENGAVNVQAKLDSLVKADNFPAEDVSYDDCWSNSQGAMSPFYAEELTSSWGSSQENVILNVALLNTMLQKDAEGTVKYQDPRLAVWFAANGSGKYTGGISGTNFSTSNAYKAAYFCRPKGSYDMPVYMITVAETEFFLAEYYAKKGDADNAKTHYEAAIKASFATAGVEGADDYLAKFPYDNANYKKSIGIAKWVALAGVNPFEGYCELRRLKYPTFGSVTGSDLYDLQDDSSYKPEKLEAGTLYTPIQVYGLVGDNKLLQRWPYAERSSSRNGNVPSFTNSSYVEPIFWAK